VVFSLSLSLSFPGARARFSIEPHRRRRRRRLVIQRSLAPAGCAERRKVRCFSPPVPSLLDTGGYDTVATMKNIGMTKARIHSIERATSSGGIRDADRASPRSMTLLFVPPSPLVFLRFPFLERELGRGKQHPDLANGAATDVGEITVAPFSNSREKEATFLPRRSMRTPRG